MSKAGTKSYEQRFPADGFFKQTGFRRAMRWLVMTAAIVALGGLGAAIAAIDTTVIPKCGQDEAYAIDLKDWTTTKFKDGTHVLASLKTPRGTFESRLTTKGGVPVSEPEWFLNGSVLKEIDKSKLPLEAQKCLAASTTNYQTVIQHAQAAINLFAPTVYASCKSAAGKHVFKTVYVADEGGGPVYVLEETVNGRFCRYVVV